VDSEGKNAFPQVVEDDLERTVRLEHRPLRIVSMTPSHTEVLFAIGAGNQIVGVTTYCNFPPEAEQCDKIGGFSEKSISLEKIVALKPDLVLASSEAQRSLVSRIEQFDIPICAVDATSIDDVYRIIDLIGRLADRQIEAERLVTSMQSRVTAVESRAKQVPEAERVDVFYQVWDKPLMTASKQSVIGEMIERSCATNLFADSQKAYPIVSEEALLETNPHVILVTSHGDDERERAELLERPGFKNFDAVKSNRIHFLEEDIVSRFSPRLADGLEATARAIYPSHFPDNWGAEAAGSAKDECE